MTQSPDPGRAPTGEQTPNDFATTLAELEALVRHLESGDLSLEASLSSFERGIALVRDARTRLEQAELRVQQLVERSDGTLEEAPLGDAPAGDESTP
ncbi:exodeoxyribonuclease VII small subunit [Kushneria aurantia]|uniref:Exodeoxyribonuclease 7 small subunit n=1 Tax=Kushneria aurantia TaxID=504092 RepID=A0ABV6G1F6_9GAMM|nr:exodeoxyribonuclease VII small subunit [Kushneria aurantia]